MKNVILFLVIALLSIYAQATEHTFDGSDCVPRNIQQVHESIINYKSYKDLDNSMDSILVNMVKSESLFSKKEVSSSEAMVLIELQPMGSGDGSIYPKFILKCTSQVEGKQMLHNCVMDASKKHFALQNFEATIKAQESGANTCVTYQVTLETNGVEVDRIKTAIAGPFAIFSGLIFDEETFFSNYYQGFYAAWFKSIGG